MEQGDPTAALQAYRDSLAIAERLAKADPGNAGWQRDLSVSYSKVGNVLDGPERPPARARTVAAVPSHTPASRPPRSSLQSRA
jgi:hypothetical protein